MKSIVAMALLGVLVAGCGSDDGDGGESGSNNPVGSVGGSGKKASGDDDGSGGVMLGVFAKQIARSLAGGESYRVKDGKVTIILGGDPGISGAGGHCQIAVTARDAVGETAPIRMEYADGVVEDCDKLLLE